VGLCQQFGHQWTPVMGEEHLRRCARCPKKQHRSPGGPWVDLRRDHAAASRVTSHGQLSLFTSQKGG
jgi:hypothetical protein